jgi:hypothetical protein
MHFTPHARFSACEGVFFDELEESKYLSWLPGGRLKDDILSVDRGDWWGFLLCFGFGGG